MVRLSELREILNWDANDTSKDAVLTTYIRQAVSFMEEFCQCSLEAVSDVKYSFTGEGFPAYMLLYKVPVVLSQCTQRTLGYTTETVIANVLLTKMRDNNWVVERVIGFAKGHVYTVTLAIGYDFLYTGKGSIDCSTNPDYPAALTGDTYTVSVAGKIGGVSGLVVAEGDTLRCVSDTLGGDFATVGDEWVRLTTFTPPSVRETAQMQELRRICTEICATYANRDGLLGQAATLTIFSESLSQGGQAGTRAFKDMKSEWEHRLLPYKMVSM